MFKSTFIKQALILSASLLIIVFVVGLVFHQKNNRLITQKRNTLPPNPFNLKHQEKKNAPYPFPLIIAHRGGSSLAPENTIMAFKKAVAIGADVLEMDLRLTSDDILVIHHDATIDRTSEGKGKIDDYTYQELLNYNFGYHFTPLQTNSTSSKSYPYRGTKNKIFISTLSEVLSTFFSPQQRRKNKFLKMIIEIKNKDERGKLAAKKLVEKLLKYKLTQRVIIGSFHDSIISFLHHNYKDTLILGAGFKEGLKFVINSLISLNWFRIDSRVILLPLKLPKLSFLNLRGRNIFKRAKKQDLSILYWTINDEPTMLKLVNQPTDGILTDRPDLLVSIKQRWENKHKYIINTNK